MWTLVLLPFLLQAIVMALDEGIYHRKRGLPRWERIGHPLDTCTVLACMLFVLWAPFSSSSLFFYLGLSCFSSLFVTKDEFVHKEHCPGSEHWLHALLFLLHPVTFAAAGCIWPVVQGADTPLWLSQWLDHPRELSLFLRLQAAAMGLFLAYQIIYWNLLWKGKVERL